MRIGIQDQHYYGLQGRLLAEGHTLVLFIPGLAVRLPEEELNICVTRTPGRVEQVLTPEEFIGAACDLYILSHEDPHHLFEVLYRLNVPVIGWGGEVLALERLRTVAQNLVTTQCGLDLKVPRTHHLDSPEMVRGFFATQPSEPKWVAKVAGSGNAAHETRTMVIHDQAQFLSLLDRPNAWFDAEGVGGLLVEQFITGVECAWCFWFDGRDFRRTAHATQEHKGAMNGDRGGVFTGEVGTPLAVVQIEPNSRWDRILQALTPALSDTFVGCIDLNTIVDERTGDLYFVEFTSRFGRPTIETIIGALDPEARLGEALYTLATNPQADGPDPMAGLISVPYALGVTVFTYGYPLLEQTTVTGDRSLALTDGLAFQMPEDDAWDASPSVQVVPFLARYDGAAACWRTHFNERQFVVVGRGQTQELAQSRAYEPLHDYFLTGCTWRDDVDFCSIETQLAQARATR